MKKIFGVIAILAIIGFLLAACDDTKPNTGDNRQPDTGEDFEDPKLQRAPRDWDGVDVNNSFGGRTIDRVWAIATGKNTYVAVGGVIVDGSVVTNIMYAKHPEMWEKSTGNFQYPIRNVAYGNGRFVAVDLGNFEEGVSNNDNLSNSSSYYSTDGGATWTGPIDTGIKGTIGLTYANGKWVAGGFFGQIVVSTDSGASWTKKPEQLFTQYDNSAIRGITYAEGRWIIVGDQGRTAYSDDELETFTIVDLPGHGLLESLQNVVYHEEALVAVGNVGRIYYSFDLGETWTLLANQNHGFGVADIYNITYTNGYFVIVGSGGGIEYSNDPIGQYLAFDRIRGPFPFGGQQSVYGITYGGGFWIAGGRSGAIAYSNVND